MSSELSLSNDVGSNVTNASQSVASFVPLILVFVVFYFFVIRPQQKKMKLHQKMLNEISTGDEVLTGGGIIGTVDRVDTNDKNILWIEIAKDTVIRIARETIIKKMK